MRRRTIALASVLVACALRGAVLYDVPTNTLWLVDFPPERPCSLERVLAADRINGWNKVEYDADTDTFTVHASLHIGANHGTDTYVQLGNEAHPDLTVVVHGNVFVWPSWVEDQNPDSERGASVNRLTMGRAGNAAISATIKISADQANPRSFYVGVVPHRGTFRSVYSGQLHMHNSTITALVQDAAHALGAPAAGGNVFLSGDSIHLFNSTISWVKGILTANLVMHLDTRVENCVFEHGRIGLYRYKETPHKNNLIRGCTFRHCETALYSPNSFAVFTDCTFTDNDRNWVVNECGELLLTDCDYRSPKKGDLFGRTERCKSKGWYPCLKSRRHIVMEVVDANGKPVPGALVTIARELEGDTVAAVTGPDGRAGAQGSEQALLLTDVTYRAKDSSEEPETTHYSYDIAVTATGFREGLVRGVSPARSWQVVRVVLAK